MAKDFQGVSVGFSPSTAGILRILTQETPAVSPWVVE